MGKAIMLNDCDFSQSNLGQVTFVEDIELDSLAITGPSEVIGQEGQFNVEYTPSNTSQRRISWSIESGSEYAIIDQNGKITILSGADSNSVVIKVVSLDKPTVYAQKTITVTYVAELETNTITVTATSSLVTATLTENATSQITIQVGTFGNIVIPIGSLSGTLAIEPPLSTTQAQLSVQPLTDTTYRYILSSDTIEIPAGIANIITITATEDTVIASLTENAASDLIITIGTLGTITINSGTDNGSLSVATSGSDRTVNISVSPTFDSSFVYQLSSNTVTIPALVRHLMIIGASEIDGDEDGGQYHLLDIDTMKQVVGTQQEVTDTNKEYIGTINWSIVSGSTDIELKTAIGSECRINIKSSANLSNCEISATVDGTVVSKEITATYAMADYYVESFADLQAIETAINGKTESSISLTKNPNSTYSPTNGGGLSGARIRMKNDIDCNGSHVQIGKYMGTTIANNYNFSGIFDGCGYEIKNCGGNISYYNSASADRCANLFQSIHNAVIKNFTVSGSLSTTNTSARIGFVVGNITGNCQIKRIMTKIQFTAPSLSFVSPIATSLDVATEELVIEDVIAADTINITSSPASIRALYGGNYGKLNRCAVIGSYSGGNQFAGFSYVQNKIWQISNSFFMGQVPTSMSYTDRCPFVRTGGSTAMSLTFSKCFCVTPTNRFGSLNMNNGSYTITYNDTYGNINESTTGYTQKTFAELKSGTLNLGTNFIEKNGFYPILNNQFAVDTDVLTNAKRTIN